jgi:hypothetical protein
VAAITEVNIEKGLGLTARMVISRFQFELEHMKFLKPLCPVCKKKDSTYILDKGLKFITRLLIGNSRFVCKDCNVTWRKRQPDYYLNYLGRAKDR